MSDESKPLQYAPYSSSVEVAFWHKFTKQKLEVYKLSTDPVDITGTYSFTTHKDVPPSLSVSYSAFDNRVSQGDIACPGILQHTNTVEEFTSCDHKALLKTIAYDSVWQHIVSGKAIQQPSILSTFILRIFGNLKNYKFKYWFAFPAFISSMETLLAPVKTLDQCWAMEQITELHRSYSAREADVNAGYFVLEKKTTANGSVSLLCHPLTQYDALRKNNDAQVWLCVADPSGIAGVPGWPLRNLMALATIHWQYPSHHVLCLRETGGDTGRSLGSSLLMEVKTDPRPAVEQSPTVVGWEKDKKGLMRPFTLDLSSTMDPLKVSDEACALTLQLMRWRVVPELDVPKLEATRCLILGAGTLGCNVARCLLGWGIRRITFLDSGTVAHSNPVRQSLYTHKDVGQQKAETAARALKLIRPTVESRGEHLLIPMPGHPVGAGQLTETLTAVRRLTELVEEHDVMFLLTDSRESRWLPSLLGSVHHKLVITAALGFDSFLVIRHGVKNDECSISATVDCSAKPISGSQLGCYFCNDVIVPRNSTTDRTLDQQCTVSRPGISLMAAAEAVELMAAVLQHPLGSSAPSGIGSSEGVLGPVAHSVRYFLSTRHYITPTTPAFRQCSACGVKVLSAYRNSGEDMILSAIDSSDHLEDISGIAALRASPTISLDEDFDDTSVSMSEDDDN